MTYLGFFAIAILFASALWFALFQPRNSLLIVVFLAPWQGLDSDFGLRLTAYQVFFFPVLLITLLRSAPKGLTKTDTRGTKLFFILFLYSTLLTLIQIPFLPEADILGGALRAPALRSLLQIVMFAFTAAPLFLVPRLARKPDDILMMGKAYILSVTILAFIGWAQLLVWYASGENPIPIGIVNHLLGGATEVREGFYEFSAIPINRMNSFGGEPKDLGGAFVIGLLILQVVLVNGTFQNARNLIWLWWFLAASVIATFSTTAFLLWALGSSIHIIVFIVSQGGFSRKAFTSTISLVRIAVVFVLLIAALGFALETSGIPIVDIVYERTIGRLGESEFGMFEDFDDAVKNYLFDHPVDALIGVGLGNIHLYADPYLSSEAAEYAHGGVFVAKAQYLRFMSEIGMIGLALFMLWILRLLMLIYTSATKVNNKILSNTLMCLGAACALVYLAAGSGAPQFYLTTGALLAFIGISRTATNV